MYVKRPLDREEQDLYTLNVTASDGLFVTRATVEVAVTDANDNSPICDQVSLSYTHTHMHACISYNTHTHTHMHASHTTHTHTHTVGPIF